MFESLISGSALKYHVPESWIKAVIDVESSWNPDAFRAEPQIDDGSYGLMQLLLGTARGLGYTGSAEGLFDPAVNIDLGSKLLGQLRQRYGDDFRRVYSAYNSGKPDLWQTSSEVARNVGRAIAALETYLQREVAVITGTIGQEATAQPALVGLVVFVLLWAWAGKRK